VGGMTTLVVAWTRLRHAAARGRRCTCWICSG
jgi:hypothetical protein